MTKLPGAILATVGGGLLLVFAMCSLLFNAAMLCSLKLLSAGLDWMDK